MFGRKKKKADLDWQPSAPFDHAIHADASNNTHAQARQTSQGYDTAYSSQSQSGSDVWTGLIHPRSIFRFIMKNFFFMTVMAMLVIVAGFSIYYVLPEKYYTKALILVDPRQPRVTASENVLSGIGGDAAALTSYVEIMRSDGFLSKVVEELGVKDDPDFAKAENETELIAMFRKNLSANRQGATYIVEVAYTSKDKTKAAKYANGVAEAFVRDQKDYRTSTNEEASRWLLERLDLLQTNLKESEDAVASYRARNGMVSAGAQGSLNDQQLAALVTQLGNVTTELAEARARYEQASKDGVPAGADNSQTGQFANLDQLLQEQDRLRRQAAELNQTLGSRHPRMLANAEQQRIIADQISRERERLVQRSKQAYETAQAKKQALERQLADARQTSITQNKAMVELANLERQANANRNLYEQFLARYKITDEQSQLQFSEARIVSPAPVPVKSTRLPLSLVGPVLLILGFGLGLLIALIREAFAMPQTTVARTEPVLFEPVTQSENSASEKQQEQEHLDSTSHLDRPVEDYLKSIDDEEDEHEAAVEASQVIPSQIPDIDEDDGSEDDFLDDQEYESDAEAERAARQYMEDLKSKLQSARNQKSSVSDDHDEDESNEEDQVALEDTTVVHFTHPDAPKERSVRAERAAAAKMARQVEEDEELLMAIGGQHAILMTLPDRNKASFDDDNLLDDLVTEYQESLEDFVGALGDDETVSLMVTAARPGEGLDITTDVLREFAIDSGYHPVIISLQDRPPERRQSVGASASPSPARVARLQSFEAFDVIPFVNAANINSGDGLADALADELANLIALCKDNYGFVILETRQILDPNTLEDLIELVDRSLMVLSAPSLEREDLIDWQDWAEATGSGLVLDQT